VKIEGREIHAATGKASGVILAGAKFTCTKCKKTKDASDFGMRKMANGEIRNQAQCKTCR